MLALGYTHTKQYTLWMTPIMGCHVQHDDPKILKEEYFEVLLFKKGIFQTYVDIAKADEFKAIFSFDVRGQPTKATDPVEFDSMVCRKTMTQPLWKLSKKHAEQILDICIHMDQSK